MREIMLRQGGACSRVMEASCVTRVWSSGWRSKLWLTRRSQNYSEDVDGAVDRAHDHWQPNKVLEELITYDPMADAGLKVTFHTVTGDGSVGEKVFSGTDRRFSAAWAAKAHRSMGSFLHQRTISQIKRGRTINETDLRRQAQQVLEVLDDVLASEVHDIRLGIRFGYGCPDCNGDISIAMAPLLLKGRAATTCQTCGAAWLAEGEEAGGSPRLTRVGDRDIG